MNKPDLVDNITVKLGRLSRHKVDVAVSCILELMSEALTQRRRIEIRSFGSFHVKIMPSHEARNPKTGEKVIVQSKPKPRFKAGKILRENLQKGVL